MILERPRGDVQLDQLCEVILTHWDWELIGRRATRHSFIQAPIGQHDRQQTRGTDRRRKQVGRIPDSHSERPQSTAKRVSMGMQCAEFVKPEARSIRALDKWTANPRAPAIVLRAPQGCDDASTSSRAEAPAQSGRQLGQGNLYCERAALTGPAPNVKRSLVLIHDPTGNRES